MIVSTKMNNAVTKKKRDVIMQNNNILYQIKTLEKMIFRSLINDGCNIIKTLPKMPPPTPTQMQIIEYIMKNSDSDIYQKDLEDILNLRRATVSGVLQTMEKNNLIERIIDTKDTRTKKIIINKKAKILFDKHKKQLENLEISITKNISKEELEIFSKVIEKMKDNITNSKNTANL